MKTEILSARADLPEMKYRSAIAEAVDTLKKNLPAALPSETVYGLAANALHPQAVAKIFEAKERPLSDPLIVHVADFVTMKRLVSEQLPEELSNLIQRLATAFWPGPLTFILPRSGEVPDLVTAGQDTVAIRCPAHPVFQDVLKTCGFPLAAPSANRFGRISPTSAAAVYVELQGRIPLVLDGGDCERGVESTIIFPRRIAANAPEISLQILRHGPITAEALSAFAPIFTSSKKGDLPTAPGSLASHYAPRTPFHLLGKSPIPAHWQNCGLLAWDKKFLSLRNFVAVEYLSPGLDLCEAAVNLYRAMRLLDDLHLDGICAEPLPEIGIGCAIMDRLRRASHV
ncbi:MAG: L-threonylcarbamoyladenylate synthase [Chthoniobacterales bacterium]